MLTDSGAPAQKPILWRVRAWHFTAGIVVQNGTIVECAPILTKHVRECEFDFERFKKRCHDKGWTLDACR